MSRKDSRKVLHLQVAPEGLAMLFAARRPGRSLSDVLRRWLQAAASGPFVDHGAMPPSSGRVFAVQLPAALRARLEAASHATGRSLAYCAQQDLQAFLAARGVAQARHAAPDPDQRPSPDA